MSRDEQISKIEDKIISAINMMPGIPSFLVLEDEEIKVLRYNGFQAPKGVVRLVSRSQHIAACELEKKWMPILCANCADKIKKLNTLPEGEDLHPTYNIP